MKTIKTLFGALAVVAWLESAAAGLPCGYVVAWGENIGGQGTGAHTPWCSTGTVVIASHVLSNAVAIACGAFHSLALRDDGTVVGWGWDTFGQATGQQPGAAEDTNGVVLLGGEILRDVAAVAAGRTHSLALTSNGTVVAWGRLDGAKTPIELPDGLSSVAAISAGWRYNLALKRDGTAVDWPRSRIPTPLSNVLAVASGPSYYAPSLALRRDGTVVQWGPNGLLEHVPAGMTNIVAIAAGGGHCLALTRGGTVEGWGDNNIGQATGTAEPKPPYYSEGAVTLNGQTLRDVVAIAAGGECSLAVRRDGTVVAWGYIARRPATVPAALSNAVAIAAGENFCLAITTNANWGPPKR